MNISELAKRHGLSRSTLLYYHRIGLLEPSGRLHNDYRCYTERDAARLRRICLYRRTGMPLADICTLLERPQKNLAAALERQLRELTGQIEALRGRQRLIVELLKDRRLLERVNIRNKERWVKLLRGSGFTDEDLGAWHRDFERLDPEYHQRFLEFLGIPPDEIRGIRERSRGHAGAAP
jgi:MerR family transcriptional regulator, thiopeptide resistance regulator